MLPWVRLVTALGLSSALACSRGIEQKTVPPSEACVAQLYFEFQVDSPEQEAKFEALAAEFEREVARVDVDLRTAKPRMRQIVSSTERWISETELEATHVIDFSGILGTLRTLPDGAGTSAVVRSYNARVDAGGDAAG